MVFIDIIALYKYDHHHFITLPYFLEFPLFIIDYGILWFHFLCLWTRLAWQSIYYMSFFSSYRYFIFTLHSSISRMWNIIDPLFLSWCGRFEADSQKHFCCKISSSISWSQTMLFYFQVYNFLEYDYAFLFFKFECNLIYVFWNISFFSQSCYAFFTPFIYANWNISSTH